MVLSNLSIGISSSFSTDLISTTPFRYSTAPFTHHTVHSLCGNVSNVCISLTLRVYCMCMLFRYMKAPKDVSGEQEQQDKALRKKHKVQRVYVEHHWTPVVNRECLTNVTAMRLINNVNSDCVIHTPCGTQVEEDAFGTYASQGGEKFVYRVKKEGGFGGYKVPVHSVGVLLLQACASLHCTCTNIPHSLHRLVHSIIVGVLICALLCHHTLLM